MDIFHIVSLDECFGRVIVIACTLGTEITLSSDSVYSVVSDKTEDGGLGVFR